MKFISNKTTAKIVSVLIAVLTWMYVVSVENPKTEIAFRDIPITVLNESRLSDYGLKLIDPGEKEISVRVEGRRSDVAMVNAKDITATIDVSKINISGKYMVDVDVSTDVEGITVRKTDFQKTEVYVDAVRSINKNVNIKTEGLAKESYIPGEPVGSLESIEITGPSGVVNKIAAATAVINISEADAKITRICPIKLYDLSGDEIDTRYLSMSAESITVNIEVSREQELTVVPIYKEAYDLSEYDVIVTPEKITAITEAKYTGGINTLPITLNELADGKSFTKRVQLDVPANIEIKQETGTVTVEFKHR
ncbi:MAG: hypothetical protein J6A69_05440 [Clostridia bacterium]|nr:hypothetical protein [Clostridia bacterium]